MTRTRVIEEKTVFNHGLIIKKGKIKKGDETYSRLKVDREDAVAILIFNEDSNKFILTEQFRYPIVAKTKEHLLEIVAGKIDKGESAIEAAIREAEEETGYKIKPGKLEFLLKCFSSPGYTSERFSIYYAHVKNTDKISKGGGKEDEHEHIEIVEMDPDEFNTLIKKGKIHDAKTYLAGMFLSLYNSGK